MAKAPDLKKLWLVVDHMDEIAVVIIADRRDDVLKIYAESNNLEPDELSDEIEVQSLHEMAREAINAKARDSAKFAMFEIVAW